MDFGWVPVGKILPSKDLKFWYNPTDSQELRGST